MEGRTLSHYRILEKIGAGGMGVVYRAHDQRLDRDVALKVLHGGLLSDDSARRRFRKEALALSKLNHPNIETVHDFDTQEGVDFLVMEYIPGQTLAEKLAGGPLPEKEVAALGAQIAAALEGAHERGVVHRDLKPGNILVTPKGQAKVLDFGLAMLRRPVGEASQAETLSQAHAVVGTLPYMAPEQLRGENVDARSDTYAAGAVLFEMATRQRPFPQESAPRLIDAIQHEAPPTPSAINRRISPALDHIILKALEKDPQRRYQSARDLLVDLERLGAPAPLRAARRPRAHVFWWAVAPMGALLALVSVIVGLNVGGMRERFLGRAAPQRIESLAVLPLANLSGDPEQEYFADGMTEELITNLARIGALRVISRTSIMQLKGAKKALREIARELNVDAVVEGTVLRSGGRVRITAQLIEGRTDRHLWVESYERDLTDVLALQSEVARAIAREIRITLTPEEKAHLATGPPVNPEAHEAYLRGRYYWNRRSPEGLKKALAEFERAIQIDPDYALAYAGLGDTYGLLSEYAGMTPEEAYPKAKAAALKAVALDDTLAEAHASVALAAWSFPWDWPVVERELKRAIDLNPGYASAHHWYGWYLLRMGRHAEGLAEMRRALELDPLSLIINTNLANAYVIARQYDFAIEQFKRTLDLDPGFAQAHCDIVWAYAMKGMFKDAIREARIAVEQMPGSDEYRSALGYAYARAGRGSEARRTLDDLRAAARRAYVAPYSFAVVWVGLGDKEQAIRWLERGYRTRDAYLDQIKTDPRWDPLRTDSRFKDLMRRIGLPPD